MNESQKFVMYALSIGAIELVPEGRKLKSGRISPYFFNSGLFNKGKSFRELALAYVGRVLEKEVPDVVFGPAYKGIPLAAGVSLTAAEFGYDIGYAFNRKEAKDHGEGGLIVGSSLKGKTVGILDDVMTTGESSGEAVVAVRREGGTPIGCVIAFDRQEKGADGGLSATQEFTKKYGISVRAAATLDDLITVLRDVTFPENGKIKNAKEALPRILAYRIEYGA